MQFFYTSCVALLSGLLCQSVSANEISTDQTQQKATFYYSGGALGLDTGDFDINGQAFEQKNGFVIGGGGLKPLSIKRAYLDWSVLIGGNETTLAKGTCATTTGAIVGCSYDLTTLFAAIPVTANLFYPLGQQGKLFAGAGGALTYLDYSLGLSASGYTSKEEASVSSTGFSPVLQFGVSYQRLQVKVSHFTTIGNEDTGKGDSTLLTLNWLSSR